MVKARKRCILCSFCPLFAGLRRRAALDAAFRRCYNYYVEFPAISARFRQPPAGGAERMEPMPLPLDRAEIKAEAYDEMIKIAEA